MRAGRSLAKMRTPSGVRKAHAIIIPLTCKLPIAHWQTTGTMIVPKNTECASIKWFFSLCETMIIIKTITPNKPAATVGIDHWKIKYHMVHQTTPHKNKKEQMITNSCFWKAKSGESSSFRAYSLAYLNIRDF